MVVAKADGSEPRAVTPPTNSLDWFDWSPDGKRIAYIAAKALWVVDVDGGEPRKLVGTGPAALRDVAAAGRRRYRLSDGDERTPGIYAIAADGTSERRRLSTTPPNNEFDYQAIALSPDGAHITFTRWSEAGLPRVFALNVASGEETPFPMSAGVGQRGTATYSPDGALVAYARIFAGGGFQLVVANGDGSGNERTIGPRKAGPPGGTEVPASWAFTPDGTALMVRFGDDAKGTTHLLPLDGSPATDLGSGEFEFLDIQRLAP